MKHPEKDIQVNYKTGDVIKAAPAVQKVTSVKSEKMIRIRWKPQKKCDGYYIYRKKKGGSYQLIKKISNGNSSSYLDKKAQKGVSYYYAVKHMLKSHMEIHTANIKVHLL